MKSLFFFPFLFFSLYSASQTMSGKVLKQAKGVYTPLINVKIIIGSVTDSSNRRFAISNSNGDFFFEGVKKGPYFLSIDTIGYETYHANIDMTGETLVLKPIELKQKVIMLTPVIVTSTKTPVSYKLGKTVLDVLHSSYNKGYNSFNVLNNVPGLRSDNTGEITFRGNQPTQIFLDGRLINLDGTNLMTYLKSIPSESINSIEVMPVHTSEFSAQNGGVVVNIKLKRTYKYGLSGTITSSVEENKYTTSSTGIALTMHKMRFDVLGNYTYFHVRTFQNSIETQTTLLNNTTSVENDHFRQKTDANLLRLQAELHLSPFQSAGIIYNLASNKGITNTNSNLLFTSSSINTSNPNTTLNKKDILLNDNQINFYYTIKTDTSGGMVKLEYKFVDFTNSKFSSVTSAIPPSSQPIFTFINNPLRVPINILSADLNKLIAKNITLKTGVRFDASKTSNNNQYFSGINKTVDTLQSNYFKYNERTLGLYSSLAKESRLWALNLGLRIERNSYHGILLGKDDQIERNQWDVFPTVIYQQKFKGTNSLTASYSRQISRPSYQLLNPFTDFSNTYFKTQGNPNLRPYFSNTLELLYLIHGVYSITAGFKQIPDMINNIYLQHGPYTISTYDNSNNESEYYLTFYLPVKINKWWTINGLAYLGYKSIKTFGLSAQNSTKLTPYVQLTNHFFFAKRFFVDINGFYLGETFYSIYSQHPQAAVNINFKTSFFKNRLTLAFAANDPLNIKRIKIDVKEASFNRRIQNFLPTRTENITLSYNFSLGKIKRETQQSSLSDNQVERLRSIRH